MARPDRKKTFPTIVYEQLYTIPGFSNIKVQHRRHWAMLAASSQQSKYRHKKHEGAIMLHFQTRDALFGSKEQFDRENATLGLFRTIPDWSKAKHLTKPYWPTERNLMILERCRGTTGIEDANGNRIRKPAPFGILAKDSDDQRRMGTGNLPAVIKVNVEALERLRFELKEWKYYYQDEGALPDRQTDSLATRLRYKKTDDDRIQWLILALFQIDGLLTRIDCDYLPKGHMEQIYTEYTSGRLYGHDPHLQNTIREIRQAALSGCYDYDLENAHYSILYQLGERIGCDMPHIRHYLDHKKAVRGEIMQDLGIGKDTAKQALISLVYGAGESLDPDKALPGIMGSPEKAQELYQHDRFRGLMDDIKRSRKKILDAAPQQRGHVINIMGKGIGNKKPPNSILSHLLQGYEALMLNEVMTLHGPDLCLLQHDGWTATRQLDAKMIERKIGEVSGMNMQVEESQL